jgi:hypothetical protein
MTKKGLASSVFMLLALYSMSGSAATTKMLGFEDNSCVAWQASKDDMEQREAYVAWARGFLSGHNYANPKQQVSEVSRWTVELYIERFCREKPKGQFTDAAYRMSDQYSGRGAPIGK